MVLAIGRRRELMVESGPCWAQTVAVDRSARVQHKSNDRKYVRTNGSIRLTCNIGFMPPKKSKTLVLRLLIESSFEATEDTEHVAMESLPWKATRGG